MTLSAWLSTAAFVLFTVGFGIFLSSVPKAPSKDLCAAKLASAWLCGQKIDIRQARISELALVDGISLKSARRISSFVKTSQDKLFNINNLEAINGIGPKKLLKIKEYFY